MNIITNEKTIRRNGKIGNYLMLGAFVLMGGSVFLAWQPGAVGSMSEETKVWVMTGALLFGFIAMQIGTFFTNRYGRRPRPDEVLIASLKGLTKDYTLYNYMSPVNHLLVGPAGVWIIEPYYQRGTIIYRPGKNPEKDGRWQQKGGGFIVNYMKIFGQEGLGRPDLELKADMDTLTNEFKKSFGEDAPPIHAVLVFYDPRVEVDANEAPVPTLKVKELKEHLRRYAKQNPFSPAQIQRVIEALPEESVE